LERDRYFLITKIRRCNSEGDWTRLTSTQKRIVASAGLGVANKVIAQDLGVASSTVATHLGVAARKLNLSTRRSLLRALGALVLAGGKR
jgi:DNA-binding CsgD family transcriptional regulator